MPKLLRRHRKHQVMEICLCRKITSQGAQPSETLTASLQLMEGCNPLTHFRWNRIPEWQGQDLKSSRIHSYITKPLKLICTSVLVENHICKLFDIASQQNGTQCLLIAVCMSLNDSLSKHNTKETRQYTTTSSRRQGKAIPADLARLMWNACSVGWWLPRRKSGDPERCMKRQHG